MKNLYFENIESTLVWLYLLSTVGQNPPKQKLVSGLTNPTGILLVGDELHYLSEMDNGKVAIYKIDVTEESPVPEILCNCQIIVYFRL